MNSTTIGEYLIAKLEDIGIEHLFGIPGDYAIGFFNLAENSPLRLVGTSTEQGAAFAADGYARVRGASALCVTYCVGSLNTINAVAGAYAEKVPLIIISGAPGVGEEKSPLLLHHSVKDLDSAIRIFEQVTVATTKLDDPNTAGYEIDRVISECLRHKRPVYIELPRDMVAQPCRRSEKTISFQYHSDPETLKESVAEAQRLIGSAKDPVIIGGCEIDRYDLYKEFLSFVNRSGFPLATTFLGKSLISDDHPQTIGTYIGKLGKEDVRRRVEESDCVILLGVLMTDTNLASAQIDQSKIINASSNSIKIQHHQYNNIYLKDFMDSLAELCTTPAAVSIDKTREASAATGDSNQDPKLTINRFFSIANQYINSKSVVVCDVGDALFGSSALRMPEGSRYYGPCHYTSMGYAIPAALGIQIADPATRPIILVGDGAFQMSALEVSSFIKSGLNPVVCILNNHGYTTQRYIVDGSFNDLQDWNYHKITQLFDAGIGLEIFSEAELEESFNLAQHYSDQMVLMNIHFDKMDRSETLYNLSSLSRQKSKLKV